MMTLRIALIPGDGIGIEVTAAAVRVADAALAFHDARAEWSTFPWGTEFYLTHGRTIPHGGLDALRSFDAILLGAVGDPRVSDTITLSELVFTIRRTFDHYVNLRPARLWPGIQSPLRSTDSLGIDLIIARENTEGEYANVGGRFRIGTPDETAMQTNVFTRRGCERIMRAAFELARRRAKRLASITKSNAQAYSMTLWDDVFRGVALDYPDVAVESLLVDAAAMELVRRPSRFDVVVASNLFGDILSDLSAAIVGGLGMTPSGNINPERTAPSMFEPVHGSAPDIVGRGIANPLASILSSAMLLDHTGQVAAARRIERAVGRTLAESSVRTPDLGGASSTTEMTDAVIAALGT
jgi:tartrate dehydrogenase/decarboxylase / D-malate dehydrogenase